MSNCLLKLLLTTSALYYAIAESTKDSIDLVFIILAGQYKIMGSWSKGMTMLS